MFMLVLQHYFMLLIQQSLLFILPYGAEWIFLAAVIIGYYFDYRKNKSYYKEALATWIIIAIGSVIIYALTKLAGLSGEIIISVIMAWFGWVVHRTSSKNKKEDK